MKVDGACLCGQVQYEAEVDLNRVAFCHCTDCQINSGCPMSWLVVAKENTFRLTSGKLTTYIKTAESGTKRALEFCAECGTRILAKPVDGGPGHVTLRAGAIRQRDQLTPRAHVWARSAQSWVYDLSKLPTFDKVPGKRAISR